MPGGVVARISNRAWRDGWPRLVAGLGGAPEVTPEMPALLSHPFPPTPAWAEFDGRELPIDFQWLRTPHWQELFSLTERPGHLRLYWFDDVERGFVADPARDL